MKNRVMKMVGTLGAYMYLFAAKANATAWSNDVAGLDNKANTILEKIVDFIKPIAAILVFGSVLMIGFEIIMKRNKADDRMASMTSLMWVGMGTLVIAFAALISSFLIESVA